jgi:four helix bundle protein
MRVEGLGKPYRSFLVERATVRALNDACFNFEKLDVWHETIDFADHIYNLSGSFPADERFGLTSQIRRAAVSVPSNIAEGSSRGSRLDFSRYIGIATGSLFEGVTQAVFAHRRAWLDEPNFKRVYAAAEKQSRRRSVVCETL